MTFQTDASNHRYSEPWPNAAHGSILDYYGATKMAYYYTRQALKPLDCFLEYYSLVHNPDGAKALNANVWIDSELNYTLSDLFVTVDHFLPSGESLRNETFRAAEVAGGSNIKVGAIAFVPPKSLAANSDVILSRVRLQKASLTSTVLSENVYTFGSRGTVAPLAQLFTRDNVTLALTPSDQGPKGDIVVSHSGRDVSALFVKMLLRDSARVLVPYAVFSDSYFILKPGEQKTVRSLHHGSAVHRQNSTGAIDLWVCAEAWNAVETCVTV